MDEKRKSRVHPPSDLSFLFLQVMSSSSSPGLTSSNTVTPTTVPVALLSASWPAPPVETWHLAHERVRGRTVRFPLLSRVPCILASHDIQIREARQSEMCAYDFWVPTQFLLRRSCRER